MPIAPAILQDYGGHIEQMPLTAQVNAANLALRRDELEYEKKQRAIQQAEQKKAHAAALQQYAGKMYDPKDYVTNTDVDKLINDNLMSANIEMAQYLQQHPETSASDVTLMAQQKLKPVYGLYQQGLAAKRQIDEITATIGKGDPDFDTGLASRLAMHKALYQKNENTGQWDLNPDKIDPQRNYVQEIMNENPELFTKGKNLDVLGILKDIPTSEVSGITQSDDGRSKERLAIKGTKYAFQDFKMGKNGMPQGYEIHNEPVQLGKATLPAVDDNTFTAFTNKVSRRLQMDAETKQFIAENKLPIEPGTEEFRAISKHLLYNKLDSLPLKKLSTAAIEDKRSITNVHNNIKTGGANTDDLWIKPYINELKATADKNGYIPLDATSAKAFMRDGDEPDRLRLTSDGKIQPVFYKRNEDGTIKTTTPITLPGGIKIPLPEVDDLRSQTYNDNQVVLALGGRSGISAKQKNAEYNANVTNKPADKPTKQAEYTNITVTNKGTIGVKNGKWYDVKTGKEIK